MILSLLRQIFAHASSRKVVLTFFAMWLIAIVGVLSGFVIALGPNLMTVVGGITTCLALYVGANVADGKFQVNKPPVKDGSPK